MDVKSKLKQKFSVMQQEAQKEHTKTFTTPNHPVFRGGKFAIMTGENPMYPVSIQGQNQALIANLDELKKQGHISHYEPVVGKYGNLENSYIVHNPNFEKVKDLATKLGQESIILSNNGQHQLAYTNGKNKGMAHPHIPNPQLQYQEGSAIESHKTRPEDFFTEGKDTKGKQMLFTIPINFDTINKIKNKLNKSVVNCDVRFLFDKNKLINSWR